MEKLLVMDFDYNDVVHHVELCQDSGRGNAGRPAEKIPWVGFTLTDFVFTPSVFFDFGSAPLIIHLIQKIYENIKTIMIYLKYIYDDKHVIIK
jgi:predicted acyltransferase